MRYCRGRHDRYTCSTAAMSRQGGIVDARGAVFGSGLEARFSPPNLTDEGVRRAALAEWIVADKNVLTWRSIVNRIGNITLAGAWWIRPTISARTAPHHAPELLDWLATEFRDGGGSFKKLHRLIMLMPPTARPASITRPMPRSMPTTVIFGDESRRLDAESIRDSVLAVSGKLNLKMYGPGFELFRFKDDHSPITISAVDKINHPDTWRARFIASWGAQCSQSVFGMFGLRRSQHQCAGA